MSTWISNIRNLAILYGGVLVLAACVVGGFLYISYQRHAYTESKAAINADIQGLVDFYHFTGSARALETMVEQRLKNEEISSFYLLLDAQGKKLAGNLKTTPPLPEEQDGDFIVYDLPYGNVIGNAPEERDPLHAHYDVMMKTAILGDEDSGRRMTLMVGRDIDAFQTKQTIIVSLTWITLALVSLMALIGFSMAFLILRRVRVIQETATRVIETGDLSSRIPESEAKGDFKRLAHTFNEMLTLIETSMISIRQVADNIAHDLRTPLTRLQQHIDAISAGRTDVSIAHVSAEADRIITTFNALLRISNIEQGKRSAGFADIDLRALLQDLYEYYDLLTHEKRQTLQIELPAALPPIMGDKDLLFQAFSNIIENAMKYTPEGGTILLRVLLQEHHIHVSVIDNGPGIHDEDKPKIFRRFFRAEASRHTPGNGLGLALVKAVMDLHKATIVLGDHSPSGLVMTVSLIYQTPNLTKP